MKQIGRGAFTPISHNEHHFGSGAIFLQKYEELNKCGRGEWKYTTGKDITFNDQYVSFINKKTNETEYWELNGWFLRIYPSEQNEYKAGEQITIYDILGGAL